MLYRPEENDSDGEMTIRGVSGRGGVAIRGVSGRGGVMTGGISGCGGTVADTRMILPVGSSTCTSERNEIHD